MYSIIIFQFKVIKLKKLTLILVTKTVAAIGDAEFLILSRYGRHLTALNFQFPTNHLTEPNNQF